MVERRVCTFCGDEIEPGTGRMYIKKDGVVFNFCSSKCFKNLVILGRVPRRTTWTRYYEREKEVRMKGLPTEAPAPKAHKVKKPEEKPVEKAPDAEKPAKKEEAPRKETAPKPVKKAEAKKPEPKKPAPKKAEHPKKEAEKPKAEEAKE